MLDTIVAAKKLEVKQLQRQMDIDTIEINRSSFNPVNCFKDNSGRVSIIAEIKKASPSKGILCQDLDPQNLALAYQENGARAISVISDSLFFQGSKDYLRLVKEKVALPVLRKDFIIDEIQLYESLQLGADMLLLIAAINDYKRLSSLSEKCLELGLEPLLEIHDEEELKVAFDLPVRIIGINNRKLQDFSVDIKRSLELSELLPSSYIKVSESGIKSPQDMILLQDSGFDAALVGEALVSSPEAGEKLRKLLSYREMINDD